jgi:hypothetical protein
VTYQHISWLFFVVPHTKIILLSYGIYYALLCLSPHILAEPHMYDVHVDGQDHFCEIFFSLTRSFGRHVKLMKINTVDQLTDENLKCALNIWSQPLISQITHTHTHLAMCSVNYIQTCFYEVHFSILQYYQNVKTSVTYLPHYNFSLKHLLLNTDWNNNSLEAEPEHQTSLIPKCTIRYNLKPVRSTSHSQKTYFPNYFLHCLSKYFT